MKSIFSRLPPSMQIILVVLLNVPIWAAIFLQSPYAVWAAKGMPWALLHAFTYYAGPLALVAAILARSFAMLPLFTAECLALAVQAATESELATADLKVIRFMMIGVIFIIGVVVMNRDALFPFLSRTKRFWRLSHRILFNKKMQLEATDGRLISVSMQDCSMRGLGFYGSRDDVRAALEATRKGGDVRLYVEIDGATQQIVGQLIWLRDYRDVSQVGVAVADEAAMSRLITSLARQTSGNGLRQRLSMLWARTAIRRVALALWGASLAGAFISPACGTKHESWRRGAGGQDATATKDLTAADALVSTNHGFSPKTPDNDRSAEGVSLAYTGVSLACRTKDAAQDVGDLLHPDQLLGYFQGENDWWTSHLSSLEESDRDGLVRPTIAIHGNLKKRLNFGTLPAFWHLNLVRIRYNDPVQLKLNYELDTWAANSDVSIAFAAIIYSIAILPKDVAEFTSDVNGIPQDEAVAGCYMQQFLGKWLSKGSLFFAHTNILDQGRDEWVFTESKPVTNDMNPVTTGCDDFVTCGQQVLMAEQMQAEMQAMLAAQQAAEAAEAARQQAEMQQQMNGLSLTRGASKMPVRAPMPLNSAAFRPKLYAKKGFGLTEANARAINGPYDTLSGGSPAGVALRITPMSFPLQIWNSQTKKLSPDPSGAAQVAWFSGSTTERSLPPLVKGDKGETLAFNNLAYGDEASFRCADCHTRLTQSYPDPNGDQSVLGLGGSIFFRHVGFGGNMIGGLDEPLGVTRHHNRAVLSPYLMDIARARPKGVATAKSFPLYKPLGTVPTNACEPLSGCGGCGRYKDYTFCLHDALQEQLLEPGIAAPYAASFPTIKDDSRKFGQRCVDDVKSGMVAPSQCEFLRCVAAESDSGASMQRKIGNLTVTDPTFGCAFDLKFRPD